MSKNSAVLHQHQHGQPNIAVPRKQTSFLSLPIELRTAIYEYLIPNVRVHGYWFISENGGPPDRRPVRDDKQPCCPAILRINRQIHNEVIGMFYGTAPFGMYVTGCICFFLGVKFCTQDLDNRTANKLPPGFRFIRSLHISINMAWPWNSGMQPTLDSVLTHLPLPPPGTAFIAECLSTGSYELRQVTIHEVSPSTRRMPAVIDSTLEDRGKLFRAVLKHHLIPLRILRGVDLKLDLGKIGGRGVTRGNIIRDSLRSREEVLPIFARLEQIRMRFLQKLVEQVSQHT